MANVKPVREVLNKPTEEIKMAVKKSKVAPKTAVKKERKPRVKLTAEQKDKLVANVTTVEQHQALRVGLRRRAFKVMEDIDLLKAIIAVEKTGSVQRRAKRRLERLEKRAAKAAKKAERLAKREEKKAAKAAKKAEKKAKAEKPAAKKKPAKKAKAKEEAAAAIEAAPDTDVTPA